MNIRKEILEYLNGQRVGVLALEMLDGSPHGSTVHFAYSEEPLVFFFETNRKYRKSEPLFGKPATRASLVIGSSEEDMKTLQMDGEARLIREEEHDVFWEVYFRKYPEKAKKAKDSEVVFFSFTPAWWRFTDWTRPEGKTIWNSSPK